MINNMNGWHKAVSVVSIEISKFISILYGISILGAFLTSHIYNFTFINSFIYVSLCIIIILIIVMSWLISQHYKSILKNYTPKKTNASILYHEHIDKIFLDYLKDNGLSGDMLKLGEIEITFNNLKYRVNFFSRFAFSNRPKILITPDKQYEQEQIVKVANIIDQFINYFENNAERLFEKIMV